jgi:glycerol-3-phosphate dehydrogenase
MKRSEMLAAMEDRGIVWDVVIIGGGATGLGAALEASSRGHRTVLVEAEDFAKGTSSRSTKLIHGGVRYLRQGHVGMVRQSLRERQRLLRNAPHVVHNLDFVLPTYRMGARSFYYAGMRAYDILAGQIVSGRARRLSREETCRQLPTLRDEGLRGGVLYGDGQFDDARLAVTLAMTAAQHGAVLGNYLKVERLLQKGSRISGVVVQDQESGHEICLQGKVVLNATGVFAEEILQMDTGSSSEAEKDRPLIAPSQGSHLVLDAEFLHSTAALMIPETDDGRVLFAIPWHGKVLLGTTDLAVTKIARDPKPLAEEVDYLLDHAGRYLRRRPQRSDVRACFSGLRPLVSAKVAGQATSQLSREHLIHTSGTGLITVIGGKWTTYRQMGEDLTNHAEAVGGLSRKPSITATLKLHGSASTGHTGESLQATCSVYGTELIRVNELIRESPALSQKLHADLAYRVAEVVWAARNEMARSVEDVLARRTRALFLDAKAAMDAAPLVAELLANELGRDRQWQLQQVADFRTLARDAYTVAAG